MARRSRISCSQRRATRGTLQSAGGSCDRQRVHAQTIRLQMGTRHTGRASRHTVDRDLWPVSIRSERCRRNRPNPGCAAGHRETAGSCRPSCGGARYDRHTALTHAGTEMSSPLVPGLPDTGSNRFKRLRFGVVVLGILVILAFALSSAYDAWRSYRYSLTATDREISNMANAFAEQTAWTLQAVDLLLLDTARWYRRESQEIPPQRLNEVLQNRTAGVPQVREVMIVDAQGNQRYSSRKTALAGHNVSDRSYFIAQRDATAAGLFMSEPLVTRSEGRAA